MTEIEITKEVVISSAHILNHAGKCSRLHGHNWRIKVSAYGEPNRNDMVVDFNDIKEAVMSLDHKLIVTMKQIRLGKDTYALTVINADGDSRVYTIPSDDIFIIPEKYGQHATAEVIAIYLETFFNEVYRNATFTVSVKETDGTEVVA